MTNTPTDRNFARRDSWFQGPEDVAPFLNELFFTHRHETPDLISCALYQARKNIAAGPDRNRLKNEVGRLIGLLATVRPD